jgi:hypothetical protein
MTRNLSLDGKRVVFDSEDRLLASDHNDVNDVYEWEANGKGSCESSRVAGGCLFLISRGDAGAGPSWFGDADEGGENIFFFTAQSLVAQDRDELVDVYDAKVDGGISAQEAPPVASCQEEATCLEAPAAQPSVADPLSPFAQGANVKPRPACKKGRVRRHGKCVRKRVHRHHKHHHRKHRKKQKVGPGNKQKKGGSR